MDSWFRQIAPFGALLKTFSPYGVICKHFPPGGCFARKLHASPKQTASQTGEFTDSEEAAIPIGDFAMHGGTASQTGEFVAGEGRGPGYVVGLRHRGASERCRDARIVIGAGGLQEELASLIGELKFTKIFIKRNARLPYACIPFFCLYLLHCIRFFSWFLLPLHSFFSCYYVFLVSILLTENFKFFCVIYMLS